MPIHGSMARENGGRGGSKVLRREQDSRDRRIKELEKEIDYAGQTVPVVDRETGGVRQVQVFGVSSNECG